MSFQPPKLGIAVRILIICVFTGLFVPVVVLLLKKNIDIESIHIILFFGELFLPLPIILWALKTKQSIKETFRLNKVTTDQLILAFPLSLGFVVVMDELDRLFSFLPIPEKFQDIIELLTISDGLSAFLIISAVVIIAPIAEELVFRGFFQQTLEYRLKNITSAICYSAFAFMLIHFNLWWAVQIYIAGFLMAYVAWKTNSIFISLIIHAINNGIALLFMNQENELTWYVFKGHVNPFFFIIGLIILIYSVRRLNQMPAIKTFDKHYQE